jgi:hypothetical protein
MVSQKRNLEHFFQVRIVEFEMKNLIVLVILAQIGASMQQCGKNTSFTDMSGNTDYNQIGNILSINDFELPGCSQIGLWHLVKHGSSLPERADIVAMNNLLPQIRDLILSTGKSDLNANITEYCDLKADIFEY